jgi:hypothetical protein
MSAELPDSSLSASKTFAAKSCVNLSNFNLKGRKTGLSCLDVWVSHILKPKDKISVPGYLREQFGIISIKGGHDESMITSFLIKQ